MKKMISIALAGILVAAGIGITVSALSNNAPFANLNKGAELGGSDADVAFVPSIGLKEDAVACHAYYEFPDTHERIPLIVLTMSSKDADDNRLEKEPDLALQITSLNAILDENRINGIPAESSELTRRLHSALMQAGSLNAFLKALPAGAIQGLTESGFDPAEHTVYAMYNLQPNEALRERLSYGGKIFFHMSIPGMEENLDVDLLFMDSMKNGEMLKHTISERDVLHDAAIIDVESPTLGTLFVLVHK